MALNMIKEQAVSLGSSMTTSSIRSADLAQSLLESGAKALQHSSVLVSDQPDLAVITFAVGIELTLKARLAYEHWHLVLDEGKGRIAGQCWSRLRSGKLRTVGSEIVRELLLRVLVGEEGKKFERGLAAFGKLAELRNRAAHFGIRPSEAEHAPSVLAAVQLRAWHALQEFAELWPGDLIEPAKTDWARTDAALSKLKEFLETKADELLPHLKDMQSAGGYVGLCMKCTYVGLALEIADKAPPHFGPTRCRICLSESLAAHGCCPSCGKNLLASLNSKGEFQLACASCTFEGEELECGGVSVCQAPDPQDDPYAQLPKCGECGTGEPTTQLTVDGSDWFICPACDAYWDEGAGAVSSCDNCGDSWLGIDLEFSALSGCPLCEDALRARIERM
jgi:hypothetical protein